MDEDRIETMNAYTFPFDTCETPRKDSILAQPYSVFINLVSCGILFYFFTRVRRPSTRATLLAIFLFELWHTWSHSIHVQGMLQLNVVHGLAYLVNLCLLWFLYDISNQPPSCIALLLLITIVLLDLYSFCFLPFLYYLSTQLLLLFVLLLLYHHLVPVAYFSALAILILVLVLFIVNESMHCKDMLKYHAFPYHILIETTGTIIFFCLGMLLLHMETSMTPLRKKKKMI